MGLTYALIICLGNVGTVHWTAPEVLANQRYQFPADVYGLGMVLYEMVTGQIPFQDLIPVAVMMAVAINKKQPDLPAECNPSLADTIKRYVHVVRCWAKNRIMYVHVQLVAWLKIDCCMGKNRLSHLCTAGCMVQGLKMESCTYILLVARDKN